MLAILTTRRYFNPVNLDKRGRWRRLLSEKVRQQIVESSKKFEGEVVHE
jgi:hypothetical protein